MSILLVSPSNLHQKKPTLFVMFVKPGIGGGGRRFTDMFEKRMFFCVAFPERFSVKFSRRLHHVVQASQLKMGKKLIFKGYGS